MKPMIFIIALITISYISSAQETKMQDSADKKFPSKVGIMFGWQWRQTDELDANFGWIDKTDKNFILTAFYNYTYDRNFFFSFNASYNIYKTNHETDNDFAATIGINWWCYSDKIYIGMGAGTTSWPHSQIFYLQAGASFPIPKYNISIEANAKADITNSWIMNIGLAYLLP